MGESSQELKHVVTDKQRVKVQAKYARTEAVGFKSNQKNKDLLDLMKRTSFKMARTKEGMNKAQAKVNKVTKSNVKRYLEENGRACFHSGSELRCAVTGGSRGLCCGP